MPSKRVTVQAVEPGEQRLAGVGDEIAQPAVERLLLGERLRVGDRRLGQGDVASTAAGVAPQVRGGVVEDLLLQGFVNRDRVAADGEERRRRAGVGARRQGRDVRGEQDEEAGRRRP